jgi:probable rRNA maturation factor
MATTPRRHEGGGQGEPSHGRKSSNIRQRTLTLRNHHRLRRVDLRFLRQIVQALLQESWRDGSFDLAIYFVAAPEMTRLNGTFLQHGGSTDVITFDYTERAEQASLLPFACPVVVPGLDRREDCLTLLHGEIFVCLDEAVSQAHQFHTTWQSELVRYVVHGVLHLLGYDDLDTRARRKMKKAEDALVGRLARQFDFRGLGRHGAGNRA